MFESMSTIRKVKSLLRKGMLHEAQEILETMTDRHPDNEVLNCLCYLNWKEGLCDMTTMQALDEEF